MFNERERFNYWHASIERVDTTLLGMISGARFSTCERYRYRLWREWDHTISTGPIVFIMLNPSTADEHQNDPTVERCMRRAQRLGHPGLVVVNLFAYRTTDPRGLLEVDDAAGEHNDAAILDACAGAAGVVLAWGNTHKTLAHKLSGALMPAGDEGVRVRARLRALRDRDTHVLGLLQSKSIRLSCLGVNADGTPKHPLYLRNDAPLLPYNPRG